MLSAFKRSVAAREIFTLSSATLFAQLVSFSLYPVLTRLYDPAALGALALFLSIISILATLAPFQLDQILLFNSQDDEIPVATTSLFVVVFTFTFMTWGLLLILKVCAFATIEQIEWWTLLLFPLFLLPTALLRYVQSAAIREKAFHPIAISGSGSLISSAILKIALGSFRADVFSLVLTEFIYYWSCLIGLWSLARKKIHKYFVTTSINKVIPYLRTYKAFIFSSQIATLFNAINAYLPVHYVAMLYDSKQVGYFAFAVGLVLALSRNLAQAILQVFSHRFSHYIRNNNNLAAVQVLQKTILRSFAIGIPVTLLTFWLVPIFFPIVFSPKWAPSGLLIAPLMLLFLFNLLNLPCSTALRIMERPGLNLYSEISVTASNFTALAWAHYTGANLQAYLWIVGSLQLFISILFAFVTWIIARDRS